MPTGEPPSLEAPPGSCDTHIHIVGPLTRYPIPAEALLEDYLAMLDRIGVERAVVVQPSTYGTENTVARWRPSGGWARALAAWRRSTTPWPSRSWSD